MIATLKFTAIVEAAVAPEFTVYCTCIVSVEPLAVADRPAKAVFAAERLQGAEFVHDVPVTTYPTKVPEPVNVVALGSVKLPDAFPVLVAVYVLVSTTSSTETFWPEGVESVIVGAFSTVVVTVFDVVA
jgi:hypothetical protein